MKKIRKYEFKNGSKQFAIYKLNKALAVRYGGKYAVIEGEFPDKYLEEFGDIKVLNKINEARYEGFFETELEAIQHIKIVEQKLFIEHILNDFTNIRRTVINYDEVLK